MLLCETKRNIWCIYIMYTVYCILYLIYFYYILYTILAVLTEYWMGNQMHIICHAYGFETFHGPLDLCRHPLGLVDHVAAETRWNDISSCSKSLQWSMTYIHAKNNKVDDWEVLNQNMLKQFFCWRCPCALGWAGSPLSPPAKSFQHMWSDLVKHETEIP